MKRLQAWLLVPLLAGCQAPQPVVDCFADLPGPRVSLAGELAVLGDAEEREEAACKAKDRQCHFAVEASDERYVVFVRRARVESGGTCTHAIGDHGLYYYDAEARFVRYAAGE